MSERERPPVTTPRLFACASALVAGLGLLVWATRPVPERAGSRPLLLPRARVQCEVAGAVLRVDGAPLNLDADLAAIASAQPPADWRERAGVTHVGEEGRGWSSALWRDEERGEACVVLQRDGEEARLLRLEARDSQGRPLVISEGLTGVVRVEPTPRWRRWWVAVFGGQVTQVPEQAAPPEPTLVLRITRPGS
ncbi:MAG TPA: hypothetical protein DEA08_26715 [Planctomycetes bacterium]|nr:hypothetical protein [Planctomycetota bacterium]